MKNTIIGIDLGTTNSAAAYVDDSGRPTMIPNAHGQPLTPSAIYFEEDGTPVVGKDAMDQVGGYYGRTVRWVKRKMGDPDWRFTLSPEGKSYSAIDLSAIILGRIRIDAEAYLGTPVREAVITVPAYFDEVRRAATMAAARQSGLIVKRLINEPSAAAIAFAHSRGGSDSHYYSGKPTKILIYDFGGGTFDVSIVDIFDKDRLIVRASDGIHWLGGYDLDKALARFYIDRLEETQRVFVQDDTDEWTTLVTRAERDKCSLSTMQRIKGRASVGDRLINVEISRGELWELIRPYVTQTKMEIDHVLRDAKITPQQIEDIVLVGGSTRSPLVRKMLRDMFDRDPVTTLNVDEAVAIGAAIEASKPKPTISDVASHSFGTIVRDMTADDQRKVNVIMIKKNANIPATGKKTFYTRHENQKRIRCRVTQGESLDPRHVTNISSAHLELSEGLPANSPVDVVFSYDENMRMRCTFTERGSGVTQKFNVNPLAIARQPIESSDQLPDRLDSSDFEDFRLTVNEGGNAKLGANALLNLGDWFLGNSGLRERQAQIDIHLLTIVMCISACDGSMSKQEKVVALELFNAQSDGAADENSRKSNLNDVFPQLLDQVQIAYNTGKILELLRATCGKLMETAENDEQVAQQAIKLCLHIALADETLSAHEDSALSVARETLGISAEFLDHLCESLNFNQDVEIPKGLSIPQTIDFLNKEYRHWRALISHENFAIRGEAIGRLRSIVHAISNIEAERDQRKRCVFISHASEDRQLVENSIIPVLKSSGFETWYSRDSIAGGHFWERKLKEGLDHSGWFLLVLSPRALNSEWVRTEVGWGLKERPNHFVPVMIEDCDLESLKGLNTNLPERHIVDMTHIDDAARRRLVGSFKKR